ncbi:uncharacterized protein ACR2FA_005883 [Aphomia sociella]
MHEQRYSDNDQSKRDIPSFIEPRPPLILNPFMRPRPQKGTNLLELFEEDSVSEEPELVQVYLRLKPYHGEKNMYEVRSDKCLITSVDTATAGHGRRTQHNISKMYTFSHIFGADTTQKEIFQHVVKDNLRKLLDGHNFTLLTYGASGSGKTFTLMGTVASPGLVPRSLEYVFRVVDAAQQPAYKPSEGGADKLNYAEQDYELQWVKRLRQVSAPLRDKYRRMSAGLCSDFTVSSSDLTNRNKYYLWVSFVEIYNEGIYDLLASSDRRASSKLQIREDSNGNVFVKGVTQAFVRSGEEAYDVMVAGKHNLQVAATGVHAHSSRSHCIFTITMLTETEGGVRAGSVRLCDLAGCERARRTRNAGARLQESRAINSSLHVLERCLHTLRRNQRRRADLVPYRESKLTRLLGAGLSGARGEAVSMVVTLNPAPEYAHETRHVLQLAAVARDIQVNNTIAESTLETTQDSTITTSAEVMRLRAENERLHFELVQAQARNKELCASMEERQQETAATMRELVEEAKDMTRQYYEAQLKALRSEMDDMVEEYENRLKTAPAPAPANPGTPSRSLQTKIEKLMTEIAILEEKLTAEHLARARAEEEVQHLRACIEERDEKAFEESNAEEREDLMVLSDSEHDSEEEIDDPCNESLEPTFKKEDINRSRLLIQSLNSQNASNNTTQNIECTVDTLDNNESVFDKTNETLKDDEHDSSDETGKDSTYATGDERDSVQNLTQQSMNNTETENFEDKVVIKNETNESVNKVKPSDCRGTYFVKSDIKEYKSEDAAEDSMEKLLSHSRGTYYINDHNKLKTDQSSCIASVIEQVSEHMAVDIKDHKFSPAIEKDNVISNNTIKQHFTDIKTSVEISQTVVTKMTRSTKSTPGGDSSLAQFEQLEIAANACNETKETDKEFANIHILKQKRTYFDDKPTINDNTNKIETNVESANVTNELINTKFVHGQRTYFDNIDINTKNDGNTKNNIEFLNDNNMKSDIIRSPSIVKDEIEVNDNFKPSTIKKLLGESLTRQPDTIPSIHMNIALPKKHTSVDIFEGFDSPQQIVKEVDVVENARKSIEKMVLAQKSATKAQKDIKREIKLERTSIPDEPVVKDNRIMPTKISICENLSFKAEVVDDIPQVSTLGNNTTEDFENIYKDITASRATEFDLLLSREVDESKVIEKDKVLTNEAEIPIVNENKEETEKFSVVEDVKYNLRNKISKKSETDKYSNKIFKDMDTEEVLVESQAKCESKAKPKRNLRLRRRKNQADDEKSDSETVGLKDILNLQKEFSDVTMDVPAPVKIVKDIPSPEKSKLEEENRPPILGIQSCPSKSVTRSRRKLFTPRIEPLDESMGQTGDSNERIYVPRPSYHRARARRKL